MISWDYAGSSFVAFRAESGAAEAGLLHAGEVRHPTPIAEAALHRVREVRLVLDWLRSQSAMLAAERDEAIMTLVADGMSYQAVATESGVSRGRICQIVQEGRA